MRKICTHISNAELTERSIKMKYQQLIVIKITFYDLENAQTQEQKAMEETIKGYDHFLKERLVLLLSNFEKKLSWDVA